MSKELNTRIAEAFGEIYDLGEAGLEYMDCHESMDPALMQHFYTDSVETLSTADKTRLAEMLETIAADAAMDIETF